MSTSTEDYTELNKLSVPLPDLRALIVVLMKEGQTEMPLGELLIMIRGLLKEKNL